jgi:hypothetical protein
MNTLWRLADLTRARLFGARMREPSALPRRERQRVFGLTQTQGLRRDYERVMETRYVNWQAAPFSFDPREHAAVGGGYG